MMQIASLTKGNLFREFHEIITKVENLYSEIKRDARRLGYQLVLCHLFPPQATTERAITPVSIRADNLFSFIFFSSLKYVSLFLS